MPAPYPFGPILAADPSNTENVAKGGTVLIYAPGDTSKTPLALTDLSFGMAVPNPLPINSNGFGPAFLADLDQVAWEGGGFTGTFESYGAMRDDADASRVAAESAQAAAEDAAASAVAPTDEAVNAVLADPASLASEAVAASIATATAPLALKPDNGGKPVGKGELVVNVKDFGALADGTTDDSAAFNAACAQSRLTKKPVYVPAGRYKVAGQVDISGITMSGDLAGYYNKDGTVIVGINAGITFNQKTVTLSDITMNISKLRFENVQTAMRFSYSIYSRVTDVSVIDATGPAVILGDNTIIGPIWNHWERVKLSTTGSSPALLMGGKDWCNNNVFFLCDFKGAPSVRLSTSGGYGAINNIFEGTEMRGPNIGLSLESPTVGTKVIGCYLEPIGPGVFIDSTTSDLQLDANIHGSLTNTNPSGKVAFVYHNSGTASVRVNGGWITTGTTAEFAGLQYIRSAMAASLKLEYIADPILRAGGHPTLVLQDETVLAAAPRVFHGEVSARKYASPALEVAYSDGSKPFRIRRNGTQGASDFGVYFTNDGVNAFTVDSSGNVNFLQNIGTSKALAATSLGSVTRRLPIYDSSGALLGQIPIYNTIT